MNELASVKGGTGKIIVYNEYVMIQREGFLGSVGNNIRKGNKTYNYNSIIGIDYRKPSLVANGYIRLLTPNSKSINSPQDLMNDDDTVVIGYLSKKARQDVEKVYDILMDKIQK